jgi:hypothetical protein
MRLDHRPAQRQPNAQHFFLGRKRQERIGDEIRGRISEAIALRGAFSKPLMVDCKASG